MEDIDNINESDFIFYRGEDGNVHAQVILGQDTVWASQKTLSEIFGVGISTINYHLTELLKFDEIDYSTIRKIRIVQNEGTRQIPREINFYNLDVILAIGYRVNSYHAIKFRKWASRILNEYLTKGFVLDDERLKQGNKLFGKDHFRELLERIREIRSSERMFYEKITDLYALSEDYDKLDPTTQKFFAKVQNKLEYAITGKTSPEIIKSRVNASMPNMGLTTWKNIKRDGRINKSDITIAKNYLTPDELKSLNLLVSAFLDHAEMIADRNKIMKMSDWAERLDRFLDFNDYKVLTDAGSVKRDMANLFAEREFEKFKVYQEQDYKSDFNNFIDTIKTGNNLPKEEKLFTTPKETLSDFNSKLNKALNYNPDNKKNNSKASIKTPKGTKKCPRCGAFVEKSLNHCNNDIVDDNGDVTSCGYSFGAIKGSTEWD